jgi:hypothetical protein
MVDAPIVERLRTWVHAGAVPKQLSAADLHGDFSYDDGMFRVPPPHAAEHARMTDGRFEELAVLAEVVTPDTYVAVARGREDVTGLWRQCAWVFLLREGRVHRLVVTLSAQLPSRPYDGTLPLRDAEPDDYALPATASESERVLAESLGPEGLRSIDDAITKATQPRWCKVARVVSDAIDARGLSTDDTQFDLHVRRVIALVESGALEAQGNLRRPRFSEVRLPGGERR